MGQALFRRTKKLDFPELENAETALLTNHDQYWLNIFKELDQADGNKDCKINAKL